MNNSIFRLVIVKVTKFVLVLLSVIGSAWADIPIQDRNAFAAVNGTSTAQGDLEISNSTFTYTIPITLPNYRLGLVPKLGLRYSSSSGDGFVGQGWELVGLSKIERRGRRDSVPSLSSMDSCSVQETDIFYLDGQELVACPCQTPPDSGIGCSLGATHSTKVESFFWIYSSVADGKASWGDRNDYWVIRDKDGNESVFKALEKAGSLPIRYGLTERRDANATASVEIRWETGAALMPLGGGDEMYPFEIRFGGRGPVARFYYMERYNGSRAKPTMPTGHCKTVAGKGHCEIADIRRIHGMLKTIEVNNVGSDGIRAYKLNYHWDSITRQFALLSSVIVYGSDFILDSKGEIVEGTALPGTGFNYQTGYGNHSFDVSETNWNGWLGKNWTNGAAYPSISHASGNFHSATRLSLLDMNGDQLPDHVQYYSGYGENVDDPALMVALNNGSGFEPAVQWTGLLNYINFMTENYRTTRALIDMNGDGLPDSVRTYVHNGYGVAFNNGSGFDAEVPWAAGGLSPGVNGYALEESSRSLTRKLIDMNGDGLPDLVKREQGDEELLVTLNTGNGFSAKVRTWHGFFDERSVDGFRGIQVWVPINRGGLEVISIVQDLVDMNGDGLPDAVRQLGTANNHALLVRLNTGAGFGPTESWSNPFSSAIDPSYPLGDRLSFNRNSVTFSQLIDMNGDGILDIVRYWPSKEEKNAFVAFGNGQGWGSPIPWLGTYDNSINRSYLGYGYQAFVDLNGDRVADYVYVNKNDIRVRLGSTPTRTSQPGTLTSIVDTYGLVTDIWYRPSTYWQNLDYPDQDQTRMPLIETVSKVKQFSVGSPASTTSYTYFGGRFDYSEYLPIGFRRIVRRLPKLATEISPPFSVSIFDQRHPASYGQLISSQHFAQIVGDGYNLDEEKILKSIDNSYQNNATSIPYKAWLESTSTTLYDPNSADSISTGKYFEYDDFGNRTVSVDLGNIDGCLFPSASCSLDGDEKTTKTTFYPNTVAYIVNKPAVIESFSGIDTNGQILQKGYIFYDKATNPNQPPTAGWPTRTGIWVDTTDTYENTERKYDQWGNIIVIHDERDNMTSFKYDDVYHKYVIETKNALGQLTKTPLTDWNRICEKPTKVIDANELVTTIQFDVFCRQTRVEYPGGNYETHTYGRLGHRSDPPHMWEGTPDNQYVEVRRPGPNGIGELWTRDFFDGFGRVFNRESIGGPSFSDDIIIEVEFNERGQIKKKTAPYYRFPGTLKSWSNYEYDELDRVKAVHTEAGLASIQYAKEYLSEPTRKAVMCQYTSDNEGHIIKRCSDALGRTLRILQLNSKEQQVLAETSYEFDRLDRLSILTDDAENKWMFNYDSLGRHVLIEDPDIGATSMEYYPGGLLKAKTDNKKQRTEMTYDALGRLETKLTKSGDGVVVAKVGFGYDEQRNGFYNIGHQTSAHDMRVGKSSCVHPETELGIALKENCSLCAEKVCAKPGTQICCDSSYSWNEDCVDSVDTMCNAQVPKIRMKANYNEAGLVAQSIRYLGLMSYEFSWAYDIGGRRLYTVYPDGSTIGTPALPLTYDEAGRLKTIPGLVDDLYYDAANRVTRQVNANGTDTEYGYNTMGWLEEIHTTSGSEHLQWLNYTYDGDGNLTFVDSSLSFPNEKWHYEYDEFHRLVLAQDDPTSPTTTVQYRYDSIGNLTYNSKVGNYTYPPPGSHQPHAVTNAGAATYKYDKNGNMTSLGGYPIKWDEQNRIVGHGTSPFIEHFYDSDGFRVRTLSSPSGELRTHNVMPDFELSFTAGNSRWDTSKWETTTYVRVGGRLVAKRVRDEAGVTSTTWLHTNHQNSVNLVTDQAGKEVARQTYLPYGLRLTGKLSIGYIGEKHEEFLGGTGPLDDIIYLNSRYHNATIGRFLSPDPIIDPANPVTLNRYSYSRNNPVNLSDPSGQEPEEGYSPIYDVEIIEEGRTIQATGIDPLPSSVDYIYVPNIIKPIKPLGPETVVEVEGLHYPGFIMANCITCKPVPRTSLLEDLTMYNYLNGADQSLDLAETLGKGTAEFLGKGKGFLESFDPVLGPVGAALDLALVEKSIKDGDVVGWLFGSVGVVGYIATLEGCISCGALSAAFGVGGMAGEGIDYLDSQLNYAPFGVRLYDMTHFQYPQLTPIPAESIRLSPSRLGQDAYRRRAGIRGGLYYRYRPR